VAGLVARLTLTQQRVAVAEAFRAGWLDAEDWDRYWCRCDSTTTASFVTPDLAGPPTDPTG
jgi:hypothetical protein